MVYFGFKIHLGMGKGLFKVCSGLDQGVFRNTSVHRRDISMSTSSIYIYT